MDAKLKLKYLILTIIVLSRSIFALPDNNLQPSEKIGLDPEYALSMLDENSYYTKKPLILLQRKGLSTEMLISTRLRVLGDYMSTNTEDKFGYLGRFPTDFHGKSGSELAIQNVDLGVTLYLTTWFSTYAEFFYSPSMTFSPAGSYPSSTNADPTRQNVSVRFAYAVIGNLKKSSIYGYIGKFRTPFGDISTYSPFTQNMLFHYFGGLGQGLSIGYHNQQFNIVISALQGGPQQRVVNSGGEDGKVDNYALNADYTILMKKLHMKFGMGYLGGTTYCGGFPIKHFSLCDGYRNPAWDAHAELNYNHLSVKAEIAKTTKVWPGTGTGVIDGEVLNFSPSKVTAFAIETKYDFYNFVFKKPTTISLSYSEGIQGPKNTPWEFNKQFVVGLSSKVNLYIDAFAEYIRVLGFAPLQFMTGNTSNVSTISDTNVRENVYLIGLAATL